MRVIAGSLKGRAIAQTHGHRTHPMSEKIRGALFNALGDIEGLILLDAFAGTGAIGIEAISRGALYVTALDNDPDAFKCITSNIAALQLDKHMQAVCANTKSWSANNSNKQFDIVIADPPFDSVNDALLEAVGRHVRRHGIYVLSLPADYTVRKNNSFELVATKPHGDAQLIFYRKV